MRGRLDAAPLEPRLKSREAGRVPDAKNGNQTAFYARREHISVALGEEGAVSLDRWAKAPIAVDAEEGYGGDRDRFGPAI
jgi:hypothetical protein